MAEQRTDTRQISFKVRRSTQWGENVYVCGNTRELGEWDPKRAAKMRFVDCNTWETTLELPTSGQVEYKYIISGDNPTQCFWEEGGNRVRNLSGPKRTKRPVFADVWNQTEVPMGSPTSPLDYDRERQKEYQHHLMALKQQHQKNESFNLDS